MLMNSGKRDFDKAASEWDENPRRLKMAADIAGAIRKSVALSPDMDILDFGCGTGLLSLHLQPHVRSITGVDSSRGMLDIFDRKITEHALKNVKTLHIDIEAGAALPGHYHLVVSSMTLHHIRDTAALLHHFHEALLPSGRVCLADLDSENGLFHSDPTGTFHNGFDREEFQRNLEDAGFSHVTAATAAEIIKPVDRLGDHRFTVFLITGRKDVSK